MDSEMEYVGKYMGWQWLVSRPAWIFLWLPIVAITLMHYSTGSSYHWLHDIFRRFYYIPIVLGGFLFGLRGALAASILASLFYIPHAFGGMLLGETALHDAHHHLADPLMNTDPATTMQKLLEIMLYFVVAMITGLLSDQQKAANTRLAEALEETKRMAQKLVESERLAAVGYAVGGLAHDIKNMITSLDGGKRFLRTGLEKQDFQEIKTGQKLIQRSIDAISHLVGNMLTYSRGRKPDWVPTAPSVLLEEVCESLAPAETEKGIKLRCEVIPPVEPFQLDPIMLQRVVVNLINNASDACREKTYLKDEKPWIEVRGFLKNTKEYIIEVADNGVGMTEEARKNISHAFFSTKGSKGTGFGLAVCQKLVTEMGGNLEVESEPNVGSTFRVGLPVSKQSVDRDATEV